MGFVFTLLYIALSLLSPKDTIPYLADFRLELVIAFLAVIFSTPGLLRRNFFRVPQNYLLLGLFAVVFISTAIAEHWLGGGFLALQRFLPSAVVFYLIFMNCQDLRRLRMLVLVLTGISCFFVVLGATAYYTSNTTVLCRDGRVPAAKLTEAQATLPVCNPFIEVIPVSDGSVTMRMQGLGFLRDPNEFAQLLVTVLPFLWIAWKRGRYVSNTLFVTVPTAVLIWGIYLTHSRGAILALVVIVVLTIKDRVSWLATVAGGGLAFFIMLALNFSGGREISVQAGSDRLEMWSNGLELFKQSPLYGVGFQNFMAQNSGRAAHNSFVVCLAELGILGYGFWIAMLAFTLAGLSSLINSLSMARSEAELSGRQISEEVGAESDEIDKWARALRTSLAGFLAAAFFLSRAYSLTLYLIVGMSVALLCLAAEEDEPMEQPSLGWQLSLSTAVGSAAVVMIYVAIRLRAFAS
jgi:putative inorganic carbon (hco3(-)) transporter